MVKKPGTCSGEEDLGEAGWTKKDDRTKSNDKSAREQSKNECFTTRSTNFVETPDLKITADSIPQD